MQLTRRAARDMTVVQPLVVLLVGATRGTWAAGETTIAHIFGSSPMGFTSPEVFVSEQLFWV